MRPPPITPIFFRLPARDTQRGTPVNCGDKAKVESDPAKLTIQALMLKTLTLKSDQGTKFGTPKMSVFILFDVIIFLI